MQRRALLASAAALVGAAGCLSSGSPSTDDAPATDGRRSDTPTRTPTDVHTAHPTDDHTARPTDSPASPTDIVDEVGCPSFDENADRTVCRSDPNSVSLTASPTVFAPDSGDGTVETLSFVLRNGSGRQVSCNPYDWALHRFESGSWTKVAPKGAVIQPMLVLDPGEQHRWTLPSQTHPSPGGDSPQRLDVSLSPGRYAFSIVVSATRETTATPTPSADRVELVALVDVEAAVPFDGGTDATETG